MNDDYLSAILKYIFYLGSATTVCSLSFLYMCEKGAPNNDYERNHKSARYTRRFYSFAFLFPKTILSSVLVGYAPDESIKANMAMYM